MSISYESEREYNKKLLDWVNSPSPPLDDSSPITTNEATSLVEQAVTQAVNTLCLDSLAWPEELALRSRTTKGKLFWLLLQLYNENKCPCIVWVLDRSMCEILAIEFAAFLDKMCVAD